MKFELEIGKRNLIFEINDLVSRANGGCFVRYGESEVLSTALLSEKERKEIDFFPLQVEYEERYYAAGKIKGPRYIRREGRPSDEAICNARLVDRTIRPLFPKDFKREVQVINTVLSWDGENDPDIFAVLGSSLALSISEIPWQGPVGCLRVGEIGDQFILNPTYQEREKSTMEVVFCGVKNDGEILINMIEGKFLEIKEEKILKAIDFAIPWIKKLIEFQEEIPKKVGKGKLKIEKEELPSELKESWEKFLNARFSEVSFGNEKGAEEIIKKIREEFYLSCPENFLPSAREFFKERLKKFAREKIMKEGKRLDGRGEDDIREMKTEISVLPRTHGSGLFCRGLTKVLSILTLGGPHDVQLLEGMEISGRKRFLHHYNFPPYSTGEVKTVRGPSRREIGHGTLVEKALFPLLPLFEDFPYTIRIVSEVLSSNGSTSMASICASSLALMDAGVPIKRHVAGVSMGLITDDVGNYKVLTDIQGVEDQEGEMDFKIAGTREGVTALQLDVKIRGLKREIIEETLEKGKEARERILKEMEKTILTPRESLSPLAPRVLRIQINPQKIREVIGPGGRVINEIIEACGVLIDIEEDGKIFVTAEKEEAAEKAIAWIKNIAREIRKGEIFEGKIKKILPIGMIIEILPGQDGLLHISKIKKLRTRLEIGKILKVKVNSIDQFGRINLDLLNYD